MKNDRKAIIIVIIAAAIGAPLLVGCQDGKRVSAQKEPEFHIPTPIDTSAMDEEFYRRMRLFDAMFPDRGLDK